MSDPTTGVGPFDAVVIWATGLAAVLALLALVWRVVRPVRRLWHLVVDFAEDWHGVPPRAGVDGRAGVMERLGRIEGQMGALVHEVRPNGGSSMRDAVDQANCRLAQLCPDGEDCHPPPSPPAP